MRIRPPIRAVRTRPAGSPRAPPKCYRRVMFRAAKREGYNEIETHDDTYAVTLFYNAIVCLFYYARLACLPIPPVSRSIPRRGHKELFVSPSCPSSLA